MESLDTSQTLGEALGPALAGLLWQTGGDFALFAVRSVIALVAEIAALRVFGEGKWFRPRPSAGLMAACYILPAAPSPASLAGAGGIALARIPGGALAGRAVHSAERRAAKREVDPMLSDLAHDLRGPLTVIRGEVDLVLGRDGGDDEERGRSGRRRGEAGRGDPAAPTRGQGVLAAHIVAHAGEQLVEVERLVEVVGRTGVHAALSGLVLVTGREEYDGGLVAVGLHLGAKGDAVDLR